MVLCPLDSKSLSCTEGTRKHGNTHRFKFTSVIVLMFVLFYFLGLYSINYSVVLTSFLENPLYSHISYQIRPTYLSVLGM
jgi:hypothetical protein